MKFSHNLVKRLRLIFQAICLTLVFLGLSWITLGDSTAKSIPTPISSTGDWAGLSVPSASVQLQTNTALSHAASNPVANTSINAVASSDGAEIFISAQGINASGEPIILNVDPGVGGGSSQGAYAMTLSGTAHVATAIGFAPDQDVGSPLDNATMSLTTTVGSQIVDTGPINFMRALVQITREEPISIDNGKFNLTMPNTHTFSISKTYVLAMSTHTPPGILPPGYSFAGAAYNVSASGSLTRSEKIMTLDLTFQEPLPGGSAPHTLAIVGWDAFNNKWEVLGGDVFVDDNLVNLITQQFRIYALTTTPTWRDSFQESRWVGQELRPVGVSSQTNTVWGPNETIILSTGQTSGAVISIPITPTANAATWGTLHFSATIPLSTGLTVDVLDLNDNVVLANASDGADLSAISLITYPSLKLRATLTATAAGLPPELHEWRVGWAVPDKNVYLPVILR